MKTIDTQIGRIFLLSCFIIGSHFPSLQAEEISTSKDKLFSHNVELRYGYIYFPEGNVFSSFSIDKQNRIPWNLLPSYELGYKNQWYVKVQTLYTYADYRPYMWDGSETCAYHNLDFTVSYNFLSLLHKPCAHELRLGVGPSFLFADIWSFSWWDMSEDTFVQSDYGINTALAYKWRCYKGLNVGFEFMWRSYFRTLFVDNSAYFGVSIGYMFNRN